MVIADLLYHHNTVVCCRFMDDQLSVKTTESGSKIAQHFRIFLFFKSGNSLFFAENSEKYVVQHLDLMLHFREFP
jgi:hypothetical protein